MRFDDRLSTVLRQPATGDTIARIHYRQLLDLLGTMPADAQGPQIDDAYIRLGELSAKIPEAVRSAMLSEPTLRLRSPRLVSQLAQDEAGVASAALAAARLEEDQWLDLIPALPIRARGIARHRRDLGPRVDALLERLGIHDRGLPPSDVAAAEVAADEEPRVESPPVRPVNLAAVPAEEPIDGIGAIVRRIEQFRRTREAQEQDAASSDAPRLPLEDGEQDGAPRNLERFDFASDGEGRIVWSDPAAAPMVVGLRLAIADRDGAAEADRPLASAIRRRQPIRGERLDIAGAPAIAGTWQIDAAPRFERPGGRFTGYCGRMRRPAAALPQLHAPAEMPRQDSEGDRMRQILHELRTPVNGVQGFAQIIEQQLFGPTPQAYRALAYDIVSDSARLLAGFDELERLVKLGTGAEELERGECDLAAVVTATVTQLDPYTSRRASGFAFEYAEETLPIAMARGEAERLVWRLLAALAGVAAPGEVLRLKLRSPRAGMARLTARLPASLADRDDQALFHAAVSAQPQALSAGMFGTGFALRLAAAEARAAGGSLERREGKLRLTVPAAAAISQMPEEKAIS